LKPFKNGVGHLFFYVEERDEFLKVWRVLEKAGKYWRLFLCVPFPQSAFTPFIKG